MKELTLEVPIEMKETMGRLVKYMFQGRREEHEQMYDVLSEVGMQFEGKLRENGWDSKKLIARGGFRSQESIDMIRQYGWDHEGRQTDAAKQRGINALPVEQMMFHGCIDGYPGDNPWFHVVRYHTEGPTALALYDATLMNHAPGAGFQWFYQFTTTPKEAIRGLIHIALVPNKIKVKRKVRHRSVEMRTDNLIIVAA